MTFSHQVGGIQERCASAKGEQSLLHSYAPRSSGLEEKLAYTLQEDGFLAEWIVPDSS